MRQYLIRLTFAAIAASVALPAISGERGHPENQVVQVGPRPYYLIDKMTDGKLKKKLEQCSEGPFYKSSFSIGHRGGGTLQFPEHTKESHEAGARMGAGIQECDVTFTKDGELVCRHDQCDLHTTTNIVDTPLGAQCTTPFSPAEFDASGKRIKAASALCCTSDLSLEQFKTLKGKMDASNPNAKTPKEFLGGTANWRTDLYSTGATLLTHRESIQLIGSLGSRFTPELKGANRKANLQLEAVFGSQEKYAQAMINEYKDAGIDPKHVYAQSFNVNDILYWIKNEPEFGQQAVYLDSIDPTVSPPIERQTVEQLRDLKAKGVQIIAPPMFALLTTENGKIVPSQYAKDIKAAGLKIITWTLERSGRINEEVKPSTNNFYYYSTQDALHNDGDILVTLDVLAKQVGVLGIFSDWSGTVTYYANCMGIK